MNILYTTVCKDKLKVSSSLRTEQNQFSLFLRGVESPTQFMYVGPFFTFVTLYHITVRFWHQAIAEHFIQHHCVEASAEFQLIPSPS